MTAPILQFKRGNAGVAGTVPALYPGEPAISLNNFDFFIGIDTSVANNKFFGSHRYWGRENGTTSLRLKLVDKDGTNGIHLKSPDTVSGIGTYTLPDTSTISDGYFLKVASNGTLSWDTVGGNNGTFTNPTLTGITTISGTSLNVSVGSTFSSTVNFTDTTDNTLGDPDTGAVQIDGGVGIAKNVTIGAGLSVTGQSHFIGTATFHGGTINLGDSDTDDIVVSGEFASSLIPTTDATYNLGTGAKRWNNASFAGIGTFSSGVVADSVKVGISSGVVETTSGKLSLTSATGTVEITSHLDVVGDLDVTGNVYIGGTTVTLRGTDVFIENKDIVLGYTTSITPNDTTANHAGVAIASTEGTPLVPFAASGINTLPDTYKQMMWFKSGTLGFATDAFAFNYGVAIGTTTMADGIRLAVGSGITMTDTAITASNFYGTFNGNITGSVTGIASTAIRANTVDTTSTSTNTNYHLVFTDNASSTDGATMRVDGGIYYNPSSNNLFASQFIGDVQAATIKSASADTVITLSGNDATFADNVNIVGLTSARSFISTSTTLLAPTAGNYSGERLRLYDFNDPAKTNYAIGAEGSHVWFGVDANNDSQGFKWYGHTTEIAKLGGTGNLTLAGDIAINGGDATTTASTFNLINTNATTVNFAGAATELNIGANTGITTINNSLRVTDYLYDSTNYSGADGQFLVATATGIGWTTIEGVVAGTISTATRAQTVDTTATSSNADYYVPFVDTFGGQTGETLRVGIGLSVNPSNGEVKTEGVLSVGRPAALTSYIKAGGGSNALYLYGNGDVSFQSKAIVNEIRSSSNATTLITLSDLNARFAADIKVAGITTTGTLVLDGTPGLGVTGISSSITLAENSNAYLPTQAAVKAYVDAVDLTLGLNADTGGPSTVNTSQTLTISGTANEVETSVSSQTVTIGLPDAVVVGTSLSAPTIRTGIIQSSNTGATVLTLAGDDVSTAADLTVGGNLYVNGNTTQVNTTSMTVEDRTIELGMVDGNAPSSSTTWDLGVLFNYYDGSAKKSALVWEQGDSRFKLGSVVTDGGGSGNNSPQLTVSTFAPIEIGALWVNDCAGSSQVITCSGTERFLQNITVDAGTF